MIIPFSERLKRMEIERNRLMLSFRSCDLDSILNQCEALESKKIYLNESSSDYLYHFINYNNCDNFESIIIISHLINLKAPITKNTQNLFLSKYPVDKSFYSDIVKEIAARLFFKKKGVDHE